MEWSERPGEGPAPVVAGERPTGACEELRVHSDGPAATASASASGCAFRVLLFGGV